MSKFIINEDPNVLVMAFNIDDVVIVWQYPSNITVKLRTGDTVDLPRSAGEVLRAALAGRP